MTHLVTKLRADAGSISAPLRFVAGIKRRNHRIYFSSPTSSPTIPTSAMRPEDVCQLFVSSSCECELPRCAQMQATLEMKGNTFKGIQTVMSFVFGKINWHKMTIPVCSS